MTRGPGGGGVKVEEVIGGRGILRRRILVEGEKEGQIVLIGGDVAVLHLGLGDFLLDEAVLPPHYHDNGGGDDRQHQKGGAKGQKKAFGLMFFRRFLLHTIPPWALCYLG